MSVTQEPQPEPSEPEPGGLAATASATLVAQVATYGLTFLASILLARGLGPVGRGEYYLPVTTAMIGLVVVHLGLEASNTYFVSERRFTLRQVAAASTFLAPISGLVGAAGLAAAYALTNDSLLAGVSWGPFLIAALLLPVNVHLLWAVNVFALGGRVVRAQLAQLAGALLQVLLLVPLVLTGRLTVVYALATYVALIVTPWLLVVVWSRSFAPLRPAYDRSLIRRLVGFGLKLQVTSIFTYLLFRSDVLLVNLLLGTEAVGVYSLTVILAEPAFLLTLPLVLASMPRQASIGITDAGRLSFKIARFNGIFALMLSALLAGTMWLGIPLIYGDEFADAYPALVTLLPGIVALAISRPLGSWLVRQGRPWVLTAINASAFVVNAALNFLLLPVIGIAGASLASSAAYIGMAAAMIVWGLPLAGLRAGEALIPNREDLEALRQAPAKLGRRLRRR